MARNVSCSQQAFLEGLTAFATSHEMILDVHGHEGSDAHLGLGFLFIFYCLRNKSLCSGQVQ